MNGYAPERIKHTTIGMKRLAGANAAKLQANSPTPGRDIALRCPRPRSAGGTKGRGLKRAAGRGADGAARHPYQLLSRGCCNKLAAWLLRDFHSWVATLVGTGLVCSTLVAADADVILHHGKV